MTWHPQVHISYGPISALVDEKIAPLILALWRNGIATQASCQGWAGHEVLPFAERDGARLASISFCSGADADRFVQLVKPWRLACELHPGRHPQNTPWRWKASQAPTRATSDQDAGEYGVFVHVDFPPAELPAVLAAAEHPDTRDFGEWLDDQHQRRLEKHEESRRHLEEKLSAITETLPLPGLEYSGEADA